MQKDEHSAYRDGQENKVDPPCNSTSVQGAVLLLLGLLGSK